MKISVIIPTYKPGEYISDCFKSLAMQTISIENFEIIIILNGCDEPWRAQISGLIDKFLSKHNVRFIQTNQGGVSNARNIGLDIAAGEYISFIDDDDFVSPNYLESLLCVSDINCVGISDTFYFHDGSDIYFGNNRLHDIFQRFSAITNPSLFAVRSFFNGPVMKLFHRNIIGTRRFDSRFVNGEDNLFNALISDRIHRRAFASPSAIYYRRIRTGSATQRSRTKIQISANCIRCMGQYLKYWVKNPMGYNMPFMISRFIAEIKSIII